MSNIEFIFTPELHEKFLLNFFKILPSYYAHLEPSRVVVAFFSIAGLDTLDKLNAITEEKKKEIINSLYSFQVLNDRDLVSGFQATGILNTVENRGQNSLYKWGHIATTYAALCTLIILGDDLSGVHRKSIINSLKALQLPNGSFKAAVEGTEDDMRFVYCAAAVSYILDDWSGVDIEKMVDFILNSISYEGGIGQGPGLEAHSGSTFCAIAALKLSNQLHRLSDAQFRALRLWLINRLNGGFNGRPNKPFDTCYSFWTGGTLKILNSYQFIDTEDCEKFILTTQDKYGGISKTINSVPDPMHTCLGLAGLSLMGVEGLSPIYPDLMITERAHNHLKTIHDHWR
ncbi:geranylgeranyl transferase type-1 subunit beta [Aethina tumida]|uniref:geranylgeranyl transferase type-1 subunit beta n=1 Tax=Aethina tumida TaxID=116153 RepID=UPI00096B41E6|nr:geranylgeranyl transferase type-1 subunit beta [Aethina tumida]